MSQSTIFLGVQENVIAEECHLERTDPVSSQVIQKEARAQLFNSVWLEADTGLSSRACMLSTAANMGEKQLREDL
jgi:hypothetical protein